MSNQQAMQRINAAKKAGHNIIMLCTPSSLPDFDEAVSNLSVRHQLIVETIRFDTENDSGDVYYHSTSKKWMFHVKGLDQLARAANIDWEFDITGPRKTKTDDTVCYQAVGFYRRELNNRVRLGRDCEISMKTTKEDLIYEYEAKAKKDNKRTDEQKREYIEYCVNRDFKFKRKHRMKTAASSAMGSVISKLLCLKTGYTKEEISAPFTVVRCMVVPDIKDPEMQRQVSMQMVAGVFGQRPEPLSLPNGAIKGRDISDAINVDHHTVEENPLDEEEFPPYEEHQPHEELFIPVNILQFQELDGQRQIDVLEKMIDQKGYNRAKLNAPLVEFAPEHLDGFFSMLLKRQDVMEEDIPH
ncbi:MAG: hypothetical protein HGJ94_18440 [Desulfosarcina sp.]|nr:hypothetical protein [Desulfosarcina sp.]